jgi:AGZA family xanthine/uracil permease-like MFS transporter
MVIILWGLVGRFRLPFNLPAGLLALLVGLVVALLTGHASIGGASLGLNLPVPYVGDLVAGIQHLFANPELFLVLVPVQIYNFIETMNNVESAEAAGDHYPVATCQITDGAGTMIGALFGSPFPTTVYIGHPAYKRMEAHAGYIIGVGLVIPLAAIFGFLAFLNNLIPVAAAAPVLVFVALSLITNTAHSVKPAHMAAVSIAMMPHISSFLLVQWGALMNALRDSGALELPALGDPALTASLLQQGAHYTGHLALSQGAIITGLVWGAIVASVIDGESRRAAGFALAAAVMASIGIIHAGTLQMPSLSGIVIGYLTTAAFLFLYPQFAARGFERGPDLEFDTGPAAPRPAAE